MCEQCGSEICRCDQDDENPVDNSAEFWNEFYHRHPDHDLDHDYSMN